jgi:dTDP-4-amino-4,6-dideoxygalactose transaminase
MNVALNTHQSGLTPRQVRQVEILSAIRVLMEGKQLASGVWAFKLERQMVARTKGKFSTAFGTASSAWYTLFKYYKSIGHQRVALQNNAPHSLGVAACEAGLGIYLVDSSPDNPSMGRDQLCTVLNGEGRVRLCVLSHIGGWAAADAGDVRTICDERNVTLVEDCSTAWGAGVGAGVGVGSSPGFYGETSVWGFGMDSALPVGCGAVVCTSDIPLREYIKSFHTEGRVGGGGEHEREREREREQGAGGVGAGVGVVGVRYIGGLDLRMSELVAISAYYHVLHLSDILASRRKDAESLEGVVPCVLSGTSSYAAYPVERDAAGGRSIVDGIYPLGSQLAYCLPSSRLVLPNLVHSTRWAMRHRCLPIGEGLYSGMSAREVETALEVRQVIPLADRNLFRNARPRPEEEI